MSWSHWSRVLVLVVVGVFSSILFGQCQTGLLSSAGEPSPSSAFSSLFKLPESTDTGGGSSSLETPTAAESMTAQKKLTGMGTELTGVSGTEQHFVNVDESLADTTLMGIPREQMQYISCGVQEFGNAFPRDFNEFVERAGSGYHNFATTYPDLNVSEFDWRVPVTEKRPSSLSVKKSVKWSELSSQLGFAVEEELGDERDIFRSDDLRYLMPTFKLAVKEDTISGAFDLFLFAPESAGRASGHSLFRMGVPSSTLSLRAAEMIQQQRLEEQIAAKELLEALEARDQQLLSDAEAVLQPILAFGDDEQPFLSLLDSDAEEIMRNAEFEAIQRQIEEAQANAEEAAAKLDKQKQLAQTVAKGVVDTMTSDTAQQIAGQIVGTGGDEQLVKNPEELGDAITDVVEIFTGGPQTKAESAVKVAEGVAKVASGQASAADIASMVENSAKALGLSNLASFRRLLLQRQMDSARDGEEKEAARLYYRRRRLLEAQAVAFGEAPQTGGEVGGERAVAETLVGSALDMMDQPFLYGELRVKDFTGTSVYGPVSMHCPYMSIPKSLLTSTAENEEEGEEGEGGWIFELTMKTVEGEVLSDDLGRPLVVKRIVTTNNVEGGTTPEAADEPDKCPQLVLGVRALDIDFEEFSGTDVNTRKFVRRALADSLGVVVQDINICDSRSGSTVLGFDAGEDLAIEWDGIVADSSSPIHQLLQLDAKFPTLVDKDDLYGLDADPFTEEVSTPAAPAAAPAAPIIPASDPWIQDEEEFERVTLPIFEAEVTQQQQPTSSPRVDEALLPLPPADADEESGMAGWTWALIGILIVVVVVVVLAMTVLYLLSRKKVKDDDDVVGGRPLEEAGGFEQRKNRTSPAGLQKQPSATVVDDNHFKGSAVNRDTRRPFEERL